MNMPCYATPKPRSTPDRVEAILLVRLALDLVNGLGKTPNVFAGDAGNRDTAILGSIDRVLW
jgi:hypothetical protein